MPLTIMQKEKMLNPDTTPAFLKDALKFGIHLGLERMQALDQALGNPERDLKVVHIAGTNGKGSVSSYLTHILAASGLKVGVYTSPFLERFSERMRILDGREGLRHYLEDDSYGEIPADDALTEFSRKVLFCGVFGTPERAADNAMRAAVIVRLAAVLRRCRVVAASERIACLTAFTAGGGFTAAVLPSLPSAFREGL